MVLSSSSCKGPLNQSWWISSREEKGSGVARPLERMEGLSMESHLWSSLVCLTGICDESESIPCLFMGSNQILPLIKVTAGGEVIVFCSSLWNWFRWGWRVNAWRGGVGWSGWRVNYFIVSLSFKQAVQNKYSQVFFNPTSKNEKNRALFQIGHLKEPPQPQLPGYCPHHSDHNSLFTQTHHSSPFTPKISNDPSKDPLKKNLKPTAGRTRKHFNNRNPEKEGCQVEGESDGVAVMVAGERGLKVGDISSDLVGVPWKEVLTPISFLKTSEMRQTYECGICYQVCVKPVRCRGKCKKIFCMKCVSDARQSKDECPFKCSSPFLVDPVADILLDFACPYNPSECSASIGSVKEFENHHLTCPFLPEEEQLRKQLQRDYKCQEGHHLEFYLGSYQEMTKSQCQQCRQVELCRSLCRVCQAFYCVKCRVPPCSKEGCPMGHAYNFQRIANLNYICDICGISTSVSNGGVFDDTYCNFGICELCYAELPDKFDPSKPRQLIANVPNHCGCGRALKLINSFHQLRVCALCRQQKECPKVCTKCMKFYCLWCKPTDIESDNTCPREHEYELVSTEQLAPHERDLWEFGCMKCSKEAEAYMVDLQCRQKLCKGCFLSAKRTTMDRKRCKVLKCDIDHVLTYIAGNDDIYDTCSECGRTKIIKLMCNFCEEEVNGEERHKVYCFECRPIKLETCYYEHPLKLATFNGSRECHFCNKETNEFHYCRKCYFYVCHQCALKYQQEPIKTEPIKEEKPHLKVEQKESEPMEEEV